MLVIVLIFFGGLGLLLIFMNYDVLMSGVAVGNSSVHASNYTGFNESINALPWAVPVIFILVLAFAWWASRKKG